MNDTIRELTIDPEFEFLAPDIKLIETDKNLPFSFFTCNKPIKVWHGIVLYEFATYEVFHKCQLHFETEELKVETREEALFFACREHMKHKDKIPKAHYDYIIGKAYNCACCFMHDVYLGRKELPFSELCLHYDLSTDFPDVHYYLRTHFRRSFYSSDQTLF